MDALKSFTALDFETFTAERSSACAIGLAKVIDGHIVHRFHSLINPIPDSRERDNSHVNGISREMVSVAPTFMNLWPTIKTIIGDDSIVCHNAEFDQTVWREQLEFYGCDNPNKYKFLCTYELTGLGLTDACAKHNISVGLHHDALDDAVACARIFLAENGTDCRELTFATMANWFRNKAARKMDSQTLVALDDSQVENKDTPFFHARTVITGVFNSYPNRNDLGLLLKSLGADINTSISGKTNIVVVGEGAGPAKLKKIQDLRDSGFDIKIIYEPELIKILSGQS